MVGLALPDRNIYWMRHQREVGWSFRNGACWTLYGRRPVEQVWRLEDGEGGGF